MRIERVLVPIDFSPASAIALNCAVACARRFRANLTLLNVLGSTDQNADQVNLKLCALVAPEDQDDLNMQTVVKYGDAQEQILSAIHEQRADIVVMGTHGRGFIGRLFIGSVTLGVLRQIDVPILTVGHSTQPLRFERILFATDLSDTSLPTLRAVFDLAQIWKSKVTLLHAVEIGIIQPGALPMGAYVTPDYRDELRAKLNQLVLDGSQRNVATEPVLVEGIAAEAILKTAEDDSADLIVLARTQKGLIERALLGSTTEHVIRESQIPVLSVPVHAKTDVEQKPAA